MQKFESPFTPRNIIETSPNPDSIISFNCYWNCKGPVPLSDCDCDVANNWVLLLSMQPFTSSDAKHQRKISQSQLLSGNGP